MRTRWPCLLLASLGLSGCSGTYDLDAVITDGRLAFFAPGGGEICAGAIAVTVAGTTELLWQTDYPGYTSCRMALPVHYGTIIDGWTLTLIGQKLVPGVVYAVETSKGPSGATGRGCFRILPDKRVENLPDC